MCRKVFPIVLHGAPALIAPETADDCVSAVVGLLVVLVGLGLGVLVGFGLGVFVGLICGFVVIVGLGLAVVGFQDCLVYVEYVFVKKIFLKNF